MFENDWKYCAIPRFVRRQDDTGEIKRFYKKHYDYIRALYKMCVGHEVANIFQVGSNTVMQFCLKCEIIDDFQMKMNDANIVFSATNVNAGSGGGNNSSRFLTRFEFMEFLLRVAVAKFEDKDSPLSPPAALAKLFEENVSRRCFRHPSYWLVIVVGGPCPESTITRDSLLPLLHYVASRHQTPLQIKPNAPWFDVYMWRSEILWTEDVATTFKRYEDQLRSIFGTWRQRDSGDTKFMSLDEFVDLLEFCEIVDGSFSDNGARVAFVHAIQDVPDEMKTDRHTQMSFVEFVHGLAHVANIRDWSQSLLGNHLDAIARIERVIKALLSGTKKGSQTTGRNLACSFWQS